MIYLAGFESEYNQRLLTNFLINHHIPLVKALRIVNGSL